MREIVQAGIDTSVLSHVLDQGDAEARIALAQQLAALIRDEQTPALERAQVIPIILKLTVDPVYDVRSALVAEIIDEPSLHADIVFSIIADDDEIALPFLAQTPALNAWQLMAILRVGDAARQEVAAAREDLTAEGATYIIKSSPLGTVLALLENPILLLEASDMQTLYARFGQSTELVEKLLARSDLPLDIRIMQAKRAASRMRQLMAERGWVAANDASELVADAEDNAVLRVLIEADARERAEALVFLTAKNMLTPALIVRAAAMGEMLVVEAAISHLAGVPLARAVQQLYSHSALSFKSIFKRSGLPQSCFGLLKGACDVVADAKEEGLPITSEEFGRRVLEALMTRYENMGANERAKQIEYLGRYAEERIRKIAKRLKADMVRAA